MHTPYDLHCEELVYQKKIIHTQNVPNLFPPYFSFCFHSFVCLHTINLFFVFDIILQHWNVFFLCSFQTPELQVNEDIRKKMYSLRITWNEVFPASKLYSLDVKVNQIDPHWPIGQAQKISPAIHVNPNFFTTTVCKPTDS